MTLTEKKKEKKKRGDIRGGPNGKSSSGAQ